jgi:hypothetical protein
MKPGQEPKYGVNENGELYNLETGSVIPDDEPVFILRARDIHAVDTLEFYFQQCHVEGHKQVVSNRIQQFYDFADKNQDRMRYPGQYRDNQGE